MRPQENGNKLDTRWMSITDAAGKVGALFVPLVGTGGGIPAGPSEHSPALAALALQCHHFDLDDFDCEDNTSVPRVRHGGELRERLYSTLCVDGAQAGVGGIDSWGSLPMTQHRLNLKLRIRWAFAIKTFGARQPFRRSLSSAKLPSESPRASPVRGEERKKGEELRGEALGPPEPSQLARSLRLRFKPFFRPHVPADELHSATVTESVSQCEEMEVGEESGAEKQREPADEGDGGEESEGA